MKETTRSGRHTILQNRFAGNEGRREVSIRIGRGTMLRDVMTRTKVIEIERGGQRQRIDEALGKLQASKKPHKILKVPN
jgi:hypothetical protein